MSQILTSLWMFRLKTVLKFALATSEMNQKINKSEWRNQKIDKNTICNGLWFVKLNNTLNGYGLECEQEMWGC